MTSVKCKGEWLPLGITVDPISGLALTIDALSAEDAKTLTAWIEPIAKSGGAEVLVTDDADGFKTVASRGWACSTKSVKPMFCAIPRP